MEPPKDDAYEHVKSNLFIFLRERIPFGRDDIDEIQYDSFVEQHTLPFIKNIVVNLKYRIKKS